MDIWKWGALLLGLTYLGFLLATVWLMYRDGRNIDYYESFKELLKKFGSGPSVYDKTNQQEDEKRQYDS